jgi:hypothetical protein
MKKILYTILATSLIWCGPFIWYTNRPQPKPNITVNPTVKQEKKADLSVSVKQSGKASGSIPYTPQIAQINPEQTFEGTNSSEPDKPSEVKFEPFKATVPISGEIESIFTDKKGNELGRGMSPLTGESIVSVDGETVKVDTTFTDELRFAVDIPEPPKKLNEVGMLYDGDLWAYYRRDLLQVDIFKVEVAPWIGAALNTDKDKWKEKDGWKIVGALGVKF